MTGKLYKASSDWLLPIEHDRAAQLLHLWAACSLHGAAADSITISISGRVHIKLKVLFCSTAHYNSFCLRGFAAHITSMVIISLSLFGMMGKQLLSVCTWTGLAMMGSSASFGRSGVVGLGFEKCSHWTCTVSHDIKKRLIVSTADARLADERCPAMIS